jgi:hypothetical protein
MPDMRVSSAAARIGAAIVAAALVLGAADTAYATAIAPEIELHAKDGKHPDKPQGRGQGAENQKAKQKGAGEDGDERHDNGLHLGWLVNGKLSDEQLERIAGEIEDVSAEDLENKKTSVGKIIKAAREDGMTVHELGDLIDEAIEDADD